jgi:hypothetical protein
VAFPLSGSLELFEQTIYSSVRACNFNLNIHCSTVMQLLRPHHHIFALAATLLIAVPQSYAAPDDGPREALPAYDEDEYDDEEETDESLRVDFPATVTKVISEVTIEVRGGNGRAYKVEYDSDSKRFKVGSPIRVMGIADGLDVSNAILIERPDDSNPVSQGRFQQAVEVDFPARISGIDTKRGRAIVRGEDGNDYRLRGDDVEDFKVGDRVQVRGVSRYGIVEVRSLELLP